MKKMRIYIIISIFFILLGCESEVEIEGEGFPYNQIHENFQYTTFHYPEEWDVVSIQYEVRHRFQDWQDPENHQYDEVPYRYTLLFGKRATDNEITEEELDDYNDEQALAGGTHRQLYYHTYYDYYGKLDMSKNGFIRLLSAFDDVEEWEINDETFLVLRESNEWVVNWHRNGTYYDLMILNEAGISDEEQMTELLTMFFLQY
ncbi:hypothetical protein [Evansella cellulosilytica]|uniref:DUF4367 domain-containing protein n=1 Tax=Evansella cellulosilytica (strain ATCC 21833 / DSM 2522 / FERM P-1141 / JCM 9156 / N-4) TaxID=649639 RepID=E6TV13_EVAC2|nr:hypothetical protein [Evansella cellulosilytica]ADU28596.1 hypothetical protein Bcell_0310 [Evansella cellulosilytica DSM 2522]